jgi:hypothetical protein
MKFFDSDIADAKNIGTTRHRVKFAWLPKNMGKVMIKDKFGNNFPCRRGWIWLEKYFIKETCYARITDGAGPATLYEVAWCVDKLVPYKEHLMDELKR